MNEPDPAAVAAAVVAHYAQGRRDLPWRRTRDPYAIWVSEIMLQQTRVATVIPYWLRWMERFPDVRALAAAPLDDVLAAWAGLGYYSRARNLHRGAQKVAARADGALPGDAAGLRTVPGIGAYTAGAVASIAYGERAPLVDGNVARVLARVFAIELDVKSTAGQRALWAAAGGVMAALAPGAAPGDLNQGLMELGATRCAPRAPSCIGCPLAAHCRAHREDRTDTLPVMPARKAADALPLLATVALCVARDGEIVLARRRPDGLYGGLWELPSGDDLAAARRALGEKVTANVRDARFTEEQVLTHRRLRVEVVQASIRARLVRPGVPGYDAIAWHRIDDALRGAIGVSSVTSAILRRITDEQSPPWTSTPRRWPTSPRATTRSSKASARSATTSTTTTSARPRRARRRASTSSSTTTTR